MLRWVVIYRRHLRQSPQSRFIHALPLPASPLNLQLLTSNHPLFNIPTCTPSNLPNSSKFFSCNTYGSPRKCCKQKTYSPAKRFRCNTYKKQGGGGSRERTILLTAQLSTVDCQPPLPRSSTDHGTRITTNDSPLVVSYG